MCVCSICWKNIFISFLRLLYKVAQTGRLKTTKIYSLTVLEAKSPRSKCHQGHAVSLMALGEDPSLPLLVSDV